MATYGIIPHRLMPGVAGVPADAENLSVVNTNAGGSGIVVIRIHTEDEDLVTYPLITGTDPVATEFGLPACLCDDPAVTIRRLPEYMTHDDCSGDEQCPRTYEEVDHDN